MKIVLVIAVLVFVLAAAGVASVGLSAQQFEARIGRMRDAMIASQQTTGPTASALPALVRDYALKAGGQEHGPLVIHLKHKATLARAKDAPPIAIEADQWLGTTVPGIIWQARGSMNGLPVSVVDAYVEGTGELSARIFGAFQVAGGIGTDFDKGELLRYLSELPVHPDAILNLGGLEWLQLDERTVSVTARSATGAATIRFIFDDHGEIVRSEADDRPMDLNGRTVPTAWHGTFSDYTQFGRYRIPAHGEVGWVLTDGLFVYWKGDIIAYEPAVYPPADQPTAD